MIYICIGILLFALVCIIAVDVVYQTTQYDYEKNSKDIVGRMSEEEKDYFVTGYEDGWIKSDKTSDKVYKLIKNDIYYQMRKHRELERIINKKI